MDDLSERPGGNARGDDREDHVHYRCVDLVLAAQRLAGTEVEDAVRADRGGRSVVEIEEPDRAVDKCEADREEGVDRADGETVEGELQAPVSGTD